MPAAKKKPKPHELHYEKYWFDLAEFKKPPDLSPHLEPIGKAFAVNMENARTVLHIPFFAALLVWRHEKTYQEALYERYGTSYMNDIPGLTLEKIKEEVFPIQERMLKDQDKDLALDDAISKELRDHAGAALFHMLGRHGLQNDADLRTALYSAAVSIWSAVEVFVKDLWIAALNNGTPSMVASAAQGHSFEFSEVFCERKGYLTNFGDILLRKKGNVFTKSVTAKSIYLSAFGDEIRPIFAASEYEDILYLAEVRHLIVHSAAMLSETDAKRIAIKAPARHPGFQELKALTAGQHFPITGPFIRLYATSALAFCSSLLQFVNSKV